MYQEKLYTFMISFIISSLNTPQLFISLLDIFPNFSHKSIIAYWTFLPDKRFLVSKFKLRTSLEKKKKQKKKLAVSLDFLGLYNISTDP